MDVAALGEVVIRGTTMDGSDVEITYQMLIERRGELIVRMEAWALEDRGAALVRFDSLRNEMLPGRSPLENMAASAVQRTLTLIDRRDFEGHAALTAPDYRGIDHRRGLRSEYIGRDQRMKQAKAIASVGFSAGDATVLATRGDHLALVRLKYRSSDSGADYDIELLSITEVDDEGRVVFTSRRDPDDIDAAFDELDERALALADVPKVEQLGANGLNALNRRDWDGFRSITEDFVYVDHQPAGVGTLDLDGWLESFITLLELVPNLRQRYVCTYVANEHGGVARLHEQGTDINGSVIDFDYATVSILHGERFVRCENFPIEELEAALARFAELSADLDSAN
jgi:hypothetical protein